MALARLDLPGLVLYNGSIAPGRFRGRDVTIQDVFEAVGAHAAGKMSDADVHELEGAACPGAGACGGQFTANTMSTALDFLGISPAGLNGIPGARPRKARSRGRGGPARDAARPRRRPALVRSSRARRSRTLPHRSPRPAARRTASCTCSRSRGSWASRSSSTTSTAIAARTPIVASLKPGGSFVATDMHAAGGVALVARELLKRGPRPRATRRTSTGARSARSRPPSSSVRARRSSSRSRRRSRRRAASRSCAGTSRPRARW